MRQGGFILPALPIMAWAAIGASVVILALGVAVKVQTNRLEAVKQEYATFQAQVKALGEVAQAKAKATEAADKARKEKADADREKFIADNAALVKRLRDAADTRRRTLPAAPASSKRPDLICLDRPEYQREDGEITKRLRDGARRLADEGTASAIDLNTARKWAQDKN